MTNLSQPAIPVLRPPRSAPPTALASAYQKHFQQKKHKKVKQGNSPQQQQHHKGGVVHDLSPQDGFRVKSPPTTTSLLISDSASKPQPLHRRAVTTGAFSPMDMGEPNANGFQCDQQQPAQSSGQAWHMPLAQEAMSPSKSTTSNSHYVSSCSNSQSYMNSNATAITSSNSSGVSDEEEREGPDGFGNASDASLSKNDASSATLEENFCDIFTPAQDTGLIDGLPYYHHRRTKNDACGYTSNHSEVTSGDFPQTEAEGGWQSTWLQGEESKNNGDASGLSTAIVIVPDPPSNLQNELESLINETSKRWKETAKQNHCRFCRDPSCDCRKRRASRSSNSSRSTHSNGSSNESPQPNEPMQPGATMVPQNSTSPRPTFPPPRPMGMTRATSCPVIQPPAMLGLPPMPPQFVSSSMHTPFYQQQTQGQQFQQQQPPSAEELIRQQEVEIAALRAQLQLDNLGNKGTIQSRQGNSEEMVNTQNGAYGNNVNMNCYERGGEIVDVADDYETVDDILPVEQIEVYHDDDHVSVTSGLTQLYPAGGYGLDGCESDCFGGASVGMPPSSVLLSPKRRPDAERSICGDSFVQNMTKSKVDMNRSKQAGTSEITKPHSPVVLTLVSGDGTTVRQALYTGPICAETGNATADHGKLLFLETGDTYEGQIVDGQMSGYGVYTFNNSPKCGTTTRVSRRRVLKGRFERNVYMGGATGSAPPRR